LAFKFLIIKLLFTILLLHNNL